MGSPLLTGVGAGSSRIVATDIAQDDGDPELQCKLVRVDRPDGSEHVVGTCDDAGNLGVQPRASLDRSAHHVVNVRAFGALLDDTNDDTDAIQAALQAAAIVFVSVGDATIVAGMATSELTWNGADPDAVSFLTTIGIQPGMRVFIDSPANEGYWTVGEVGDTSILFEEVMTNEANVALTISKDGGGKVYIPKGTARTTSTLYVPFRVSLFGDGHLESVIHADHDGYALQQRGHPLLSSEGRSHFYDFGIRGNYDAEPGDRTEIGFYCESSLDQFSRLRIEGCTHGLVLDRSIDTLVSKVQFDANTGAGIWIVNGPDVTDGAEGGRTNTLAIRDCSFLGGGYGIADDGGDQHHVSGCTFEQQSIASFRLAGVHQSKISTCYIESTGLLFVNTTLEDAATPGSTVQLEFEKCLFISQHTIAEGAAPEVYFKHCQFRSTFDEPGTPSTAFIGADRASRLVFDDCYDLQEYGLVDNMPAHGRLLAAGGPSTGMILQSYQAPTHFGSPGDLSWNQGTSNVPLIASGLAVKVIELDPPGGVYFYEIEAPGDFSGLGFRPGMRIEVGGFTDPDNNGVKHIASFSNSNSWMIVRETNLSEEDAGGGYVADVTMSFVPTPAVGWVCENGKWTTFGDVSHGTFHVRGVVIDDVADLEAFAAVTGGTPIDGVTYAQGDRVLLANQTAAEENGVYVVGLVDAVAGEAALTRAPDLPDGVLFTAGAVFEVLKGDLFGLTTWKAITDGPIIIGTDGFALYPRTVQGSLTLTDGEETIACPVLDDSKTMVTLTRTSFVGAADTLEYVVVSRSEGIAGTVDVRACDDTGGANTGDDSTLAWLVTNW